MFLLFVCFFKCLLRFPKYLIVEMITGAQFHRHPGVQGLSFSVWLLWRVRAHPVWKQQCRTLESST